ncbi:hypothetical protein L7F22_002786 [Adiantum nelumboides]|nr:hypothetical protein [Adiantum nelumboides]
MTLGVGLSGDVQSVNAITSCICYDDSMECEIDAIFALHAEFYDVEVQRYLMKPIQIDERKPIQDAFQKVFFAHSTESGQAVSLTIEDTQLMELLDDALEGFLFSSTICSSQHSEVCDLKPCRDEKESELMQMLDEFLEDFRPFLCQDVLQREVGNAMESIEILDDMETRFAKLQLVSKGGHGSHRGLMNLMAYLKGNRNFPRLRIGIGLPPEKMDPKAFVLQKFCEQERKLVEKSLKEGVKILRLVATNGIEKTMDSMKKA